MVRVRLWLLSIGFHRLPIFPSFHSTRMDSKRLKPLVILSIYLWWSIKSLPMTQLHLLSFIGIYLHVAKTIQIMHQDIG